MESGGYNYQGAYSRFQSRCGWQPLSKYQFHSRCYHLLVDSDEIEYGRLEELHSQNFQFVSIEMLKDLNLLLYLDQEEFWRHLQSQEDQSELAELCSGGVGEPVRCKLRLCLQSCLNTFARKAYLQYNLPPDPQHLCRLRRLPQFWLRVWGQLKKVLLLLFYRICLSEKEEHRGIRFHGWYVDTCKLLDLSLIFGKQNPEILKKMCSQVYRSSAEQQDCREAVGLALEQLKKACSELHFCKIDLKEVMEEGNKEELRCEQPLEVLAQSLSSLLFKIWDVVLNLQSILRYFPASCRRVLLEEALVFKRVIMVYCKLREKMEQEWELGEYRGKYATFSQLIYQQVTLLLALALPALHSLLSDLQHSPQPHLRPLKTTLINICHFLFLSPALHYHDRHHHHKSTLYRHYQAQLAQSIIEASPAQPLFSNALSIALFNPNHPNFTNLVQASLFQANFRKNTLRQLEGLKHYEHWRLPSLQQLQLIGQREQVGKQAQPAQIKQAADKTIPQQALKQYEDELQQDHPSTGFALENCLTLEQSQQEPELGYLHAEHLEKRRRKSKRRSLSNCLTKESAKPQQRQHEKQGAGEKGENSFASLSLSMIEHRQKSSEVVSFDWNELGSSLASAQVSDNTGLTQTEWSQSESGSLSVSS